MRNRAMEMRHLDQADRHISEGEMRVRAMEATIGRAVALNMNTDQGRVSLALVVDILAVCKAHRLLILRAIADISHRDRTSDISN